MDSFGPLVDVAWLRARLGDPHVTVVDCRWQLGEPGAGERLHEQGHIPGAAFLDVDRDLSAPPGQRGRHPLPAADDFERGCSEQPPGDFRARPRSGDVAPLDEVRARTARGDRSLVLVDARAAERYRGEREPIHPIAGHIPWAVNVPSATLHEQGRFRAPRELRERLAAAGVAPGADVVAYCGSGVSATVLIAAANAAGIEGMRLYAGSWSEWCGQALPAATDN